MHCSWCHRRGCARQCGRERGETCAELPAYGVANGIAAEHESKRVAKRADLRLRHIGRLHRETPGAIDVADHRECAAIGMREKPPWQCRDERLGGQRRRRASLRKVHGELIRIWSAVAETGK